MAKSKPQQPRSEFRLRLKSGQHVSTDRSKPVLDDDGKPTGRYERVTVNEGGEITARSNLAEKEPQRYELIGGTEASQADRIADLERQLAEARAQGAGYGTTPGDVTAYMAEHAPAVAPGGQVSTGYQKSTGTRSAAMLPDEAAEHGGLPAGIKEDANAGGGSAGGDESDDGLDDMTKAELRETADREGVHVPANASKDEHVRAIRKERGNR